MSFFNDCSCGDMEWSAFSAVGMDELDSEEFAEFFCKCAVGKHLNLDGFVGGWWCAAFVLHSGFDGMLGH